MRGMYASLMTRMMEFLAMTNQNIRVPLSPGGIPQVPCSKMERKMASQSTCPTSVMRGINPEHFHPRNLYISNPRQPPHYTWRRKVKRGRK